MLDDLASVQLEESPRRIALYSNLASISITPEEAIFHFGERSEDDPNKGVEVATVYLSLTHAKRFAIAMFKILKQHEAIFGEIPADIKSKILPEALKKLGLEATEANADKE